MKPVDMTALVLRARELLPQWDDDRAHWETCNALADEFDLWVDDAFPIWLSRVVEGEMRDLQEGAVDPRTINEDLADRDPA